MNESDTEAAGGRRPAAEEAEAAGCRRQAADGNETQGLPPPAVSCDYCRRVLEDGDGYYQLVIGMDDAPSFVGQAPGEGSLTQQVSESVACSRCEPAVSSAMDAVAMALWQLREPDGTEGDPERYHQIIDAEPDTERFPCPATVKTS